MMKCPHHDDSIASMALYEDGGSHCFGCGYHKSAAPSATGPSAPASVKLKEDIKLSLERINLLPKKEIRGIPNVPYDENGFYIVYPNTDYYKLRRWDQKDPANLGKEKPKYGNPPGHSSPLFWARQKELSWEQDLILIEGEMNALSMKLLDPWSDICSPGSSGDFYSKKNEQYLPLWRKYDKVYIVVDNDTAGFRAAASLKLHLPGSTVVFTVPDVNAMLTEYGKEETKRRLKEAGLEL